MVEYKQNHIILAEKIKLPDNFLNLLKKAITKIYGCQWQIVITKQNQVKTDYVQEQSLQEQDEKIMYDKMKEFAASSEFSKIKEIFPKAEIKNTL